MMQLVNTTTGALVAGQVRRADRFVSRLVGLLGRRRLRPGEALWLEPCAAVHTAFMLFAIDVAFVDRDGVVLAVAERLRPWRAVGPHRGAFACVELEPGALARAGVAVGHRLALMEVRAATGFFTGRRPSV